MSEDLGSVGGALPEQDAQEGAQAAPAPADRRGWALLGGSVLLYLLLFAWFFPPTHGIEDEVGFLNIASIWARGALTVEGAGLEQLSESQLGPRGHVGWRKSSQLYLPRGLGRTRRLYWPGISENSQSQEEIHQHRKCQQDKQGQTNIDRGAHSGGRTFVGLEASTKFAANRKGHSVAHG